MSFILDALRKSESERQQGAIPSVTRVPMMTGASNRLPRWALGVIVLLGAGLAGVGAAWWQNAQRAAPVALEPVEVARAPLAAPVAAPRSAERRELMPEAGTAVPLRQLAETVTSPTQQPPPRQAAQAGTASPRPAEPPPARGVTRVAETSLPTAEELTRDGVMLPLLQLQLHGYADNPAERFVFINGHRYSEGDALSEGPRLLSIHAEGVILDHQGTQFRLPRE